jgi:hypothetical protein
VCGEECKPDDRCFASVLVGATTREDFVLVGALWVPRLDLQVKTLCRSYLVVPGKGGSLYVKALSGVPSDFL